MNSWGESRHLFTEISEPLVLGIGEKDLSKCIPFETLKHDFHPKNDNTERNKQRPIGEHMKCARGMEVGKKYMRGEDLRVCLLKNKMIDLSNSFKSPEVANNQKNREYYLRILFFKLSLTCCHKETFLIPRIIFGYRRGSCQAFESDYQFHLTNWTEDSERLWALHGPESGSRKVNACPWRPGEFVQHQATDAQGILHNLQMGECIQAGLKLVCLIL